MLFFSIRKRNLVLHLSQQWQTKQDFYIFYCMLKERTLRSFFEGEWLNSTWIIRYGVVLTAACECLFFEKIRFEDNLIFLYFMNTECIQLFVQIVIYEISQIKRKRVVLDWGNRLFKGFISSSVLMGNKIGWNGQK